MHEKDWVLNNLQKVHIQFSIITQFSSIGPIDRTLLGATNPGQSEPGSDGNNGILGIHQNSSII